MKLMDLAKCGITSPHLVQSGVVIRSSIQDEEWDGLLASEETSPPALIKSMAAEENFKGELGSGIDVDNRAFPFVASAKSVDRDSDVILPSAFKHGLRWYKANPVIPWAHDIRFPPVARASDFVFTDDIFGATANFGKTPFAEEVFTLYADGIMNAFSVGFLSVAIDREPIMDGQRGLTFTKVDLLEISAVVVPSNRQALIQRGSGHIRGLAKAIRDIPGDTLETQVRIRSAAERFGLNDLDHRTFISLDVGECFPELSEPEGATGADDAPDEASLKEVESREEVRMFKLYGIPKNLKQALSNLFAKHNVQVEEGKAEELLTECDELIQEFKDSEDGAGAILRQTEGRVQEVSKALEELSKAVDAAQHILLGQIEEVEEEEKEVEQEEVKAPEGDGTEEADIAEEKEEEAEEVKEVEQEEVKEEFLEPQYKLTDAEKAKALADVREGLLGLAGNTELSAAEKDAKAAELRELLVKADIPLTGEAA